MELGQQPAGDGGRRSHLEGANGAGLPHWPPYSADQREVMIMDAESRIEQDPDNQLRKRWGDA